MAKTGAIVELYYSGVWNDITATDDVYTRDPITITRGRANEAQRVSPSRLDTTIENRDGKYSPRNPTSPLYGLIGRNTPIRVSIRNALDRFTRSVSNGWGTADSGQAWSIVVGTAADFAVDGARGTMTHSAVGATHSEVLPLGIIDVDATIDVDHNIGGVAGGNLVTFVDFRRVDANNAFRLFIRWKPTGNVATAELVRVLAGTPTTIAAEVNIPSATSTSSLTVRVRAFGRVAGGGTLVRAKAWLVGQTEPANWLLTTTDFAIDSPGDILVASFRDTGNTNNPTVFRFDNLDIRDFRVHCEVESLPQRWNVKGSDVWAPITANGILRRLNAPGTTKPALSPLRRAVKVAAPSAYWPLEDGSTATVGASGLSGGTPTDPIAGAGVFGAAPIGFGAAAGVSFVDGGSLIARTGQSSGATPGGWEFEFVAGFKTLPSLSVGALRAVAYARSASTPFGNLGVGVTNDAGTIKWANLKFDQVGTGSFVALQPIVAGHLYHFRVRGLQSGGNAGINVYIDGVSSFDDTSAGTLTMPTSIALNTTHDPAIAAAANVAFLSSLAFWDTPRSSPISYLAASGHDGETAAARMTRLCAEDGIVFTVVGDGTLSERVGAQRTAPFLELLHDSADADGGILYEPRDYLGLAYRTHRSLYNQAVIASLDYEAGGEVAPPLEPVEDTDATGNDITVTRYLGASARAVQETGPLNVQEPPNGVGRYAKEHTLVLYSDSQCFQQAYWKRHLGTWDEARYPVVNMDLTAMAVEGANALVVNARDLDVAGWFAITNPPPWLPPETIRLLAQGFVETLESHRHTVAVNATPSLPYQVGVLDNATFGRLDSADTTLNEALDTTETGVDVISTGVPWSTTAEPYDVIVGGETMNVTVCTGAGLSQTFTVTRSTNGQVKSHSAGAPVRLFNPMRLAR